MLRGMGMWYPAVSLFVKKCCLTPIF
jgi:hypothetical protein